MAHLIQNNDKLRQQNVDYLTVLLDGFKYNPDDYKNCSQNFDIECPAGHKFQDSYYNIKRRYKRDPQSVCKACIGKEKNTKENSYALLTSYCEEYKFTLLTTFEEYKSIHTKITAVCPTGHENTVSAEQFRKRQILCKTCRELENMDEQEVNAFYNCIVEFCRINNLTLHTQKITTKHDIFDYTCPFGHNINCKMNKLPTVICEVCNLKRTRAKVNRRKCNELPYIKIFDSLLANARSSDNKRSRKFDLDYRWVYEQFTKQDSKCFYTKVEMALEESKWNSCSIDRLDNNKGHTKDNCILDITPVNTGKQKINHEQFLICLDQIYDAEYKPLDKKQIQEIRKRSKVCRRDDKLKERDCISATSVECIELVNKYDNRCAITGAPLHWHPTAANRGSFDRIDNVKGHTINNIRPVLYLVNEIRLNNLTDEETKNIYELLLKHAL